MSVPGIQTVADSQAPLGSGTGFLELRIYAESFADVQEVRIGCANRMERADLPPELFEDQLAQLLKAEGELRKALIACYRREVPAEIVAWQKESRGIGDSTLARLLGTIGHPVIATPYRWEVGKAPAGHVCDPERCGRGRHLVAEPVFARTVGQLWSYCGHGDPARRKRKGMTQDEAFALGNPRAKMLVHLIAESAMKCRQPIEHAPPISHSTGDTLSDPQATERATSTCCPPADGSPAASIPGSHNQTSTDQREPFDPEPMVHPQPIAFATPGESSEATMEAQPMVRAPRNYRAVYEAAREKYDERVHAEPCVRCGPSGKPALEGSPWSKGHQHAAALRLVGKEILRDLWVAAGGSEFHTIPKRSTT